MAVPVCWRKLSLTRSRHWTMAVISVSMNDVTWAEMFLESVIRCAIIRRIRSISWISTLPPSFLVGEEAGAVVGVAGWVRFSKKRTRSFFVTRLSTPVPSMFRSSSMLTPSSLAMLSTKGEKKPLLASLPVAGRAGSSATLVSVGKPSEAIWSSKSSATSLRSSSVCCTAAFSWLLFSVGAAGTSEATLPVFVDSATCSRATGLPILTTWPSSTRISIRVPL